MFDKLHEECGVFGIFGHPEAANMTYLGLYALQHRGQESAGIAASDGTKVRISRAMGYVADTFDAAELSNLPGTLALGHVRYSTAGESKLSNAQPILIDCAHGRLRCVTTATSSTRASCATSSSSRDRSSSRTATRK
jgi:amidophosphoribosyltransferase